MTELLIGTKKGLFYSEGDVRSGFELKARYFEGETVEYAIRDPRTGRHFASVTSGFFGPRLMFSDDPSREWTQAKGPAFPDSTDASLVRIWVIAPAEEPGVVWAGVDPAALFRSEDDGETWEMNRGLWEVPTRPEWNPGLGGLALHSICPWPGDPDRIAVGISAAGVWLTDDRGETWRTGYEGLVAGYLPEEAREATHTLCVHNMHRAPRRPERLFMQFHGSVYRSDDAGSSWSDISEGLPSGFGFPLLIDPADPQSAFVVPIKDAGDRTLPDGAMRVYTTRDAGGTWSALHHGLPQENAYLMVLRQAFGGVGEAGAQELYVGATSGEVFGSADAGRSWMTVAPRLAPVTSVRGSS